MSNSLTNSFNEPLQTVLKTAYARSRIYQNDLLKDDDIITLVEVETPDGLYQKTEQQFIKETNNGDLIITPFTLDRKFWQINQKKSKNGTYKLQTYAVTRLAEPREGMKYVFPPNATFPDSMPFIPPRLVEKFERGENIKNLVLTEGYLKALVASVHEDLDIIGLPSITIFKSKETATNEGRVGGLFQDITTLAAKSQNVIILWDGDACHFSQKDLDEERDLARRPQVFAAQVIQLKDCLKHLDCDIYFSIVRSNSFEQRPKGIDDLVLTAQKLGISKGAIKYDLTNFNGEQKYFYTVNITKKTKGIYELLGLNSVQRFYELNENRLKDVETFFFQKKTYTIDQNRNITEKPLYDPNDYDFYRLEIKRDRYGKEFDRSIVLNSVRLLKILRRLGFRRMDLEEHTFLVRVQNNIVEEVNAKKIMDAFDAHLHKLPEILNDGTPRELILDKIYKSENTYFGTMLYRLASDDTADNWEFNEDTQTTSFFYYKNGYVRVSYDKVEFLPYSTLTKKIWKNQILQRDFTLITEGSELHKRPFAWAKFVAYIANSLPTKPNPDRNEDLMRIIGYSMHRFFETKLKAVIFTDSRLEDDASGRSGKTLLCKGIGHMLNATKYGKSYVEINGKDFDEQDRFKWQELALDTKLVHLNDVKPNFSVESRYNDITEGFKRQRKNEQAYSVQSKLIISSNRTVKVHGDSSKDRIVEFEMSAYFNAKWTPYQEFDQWFFRDWTPEEWALFDNFMLKCVQFYLRKGLPVPMTINLEKRKLREETCKDFVEFMSETITDDKMIYKKELWRLFKETYPDWEKITSNRFSIWLKRYTEFTEYTFEEKRDRDKKDEALTFKLKVK